MYGGGGGRCVYFLKKSGHSISHSQVGKIGVHCPQPVRQESATKCMGGDMYIPPPPLQTNLGLLTPNHGSQPKSHSREFLISTHILGNPGFPYPISDFHINPRFPHPILDHNLNLIPGNPRFPYPIPSFPHPSRILTPHSQT